MKCSIPRPDIVRGSNRFSVTPLSIWVDVERVDSPVVADVPSLRHARFWLERFRVLYGESLKERSDEMILRYASYDVRVQALGFCSIAVMKQTFPVSRHHITFTTTTGCQQYR